MTLNVLYNEVVGTVSIGGENKNAGQVHIVTTRKYLKKMKRGESYLAKIPHDGGGSWWGFGVVSIGSKIIVIGGLGGGTNDKIQFLDRLFGLGDGTIDKIQVLDLENVSNYEEAKKRNWEVVARLKVAIQEATIQVVNNKLWIESMKFRTNSKHPIQVCNIENWVCTKHDNLIKTKEKKDGLWFPISYQQSDSIHYIGGSYSTDSCQEQIINLEQPPTATCRKSVDIEFDGIKDKWYHFVNIQT